MRVAIYARVSTLRQAQTQTIEQQLERLVSYVSQQRWDLPENNIFRDDGRSGASLNRPGLDNLRDRMFGNHFPGPAGKELCSPDGTVGRVGKIWLSG
jgi:site-specific DNA recombinase